MQLSIAQFRLGVAPLAGLASLAYACASLMWAPGVPLLSAAHLLSILAAFVVGWTWPRLERDVALGYCGLAAFAWVFWEFAEVLNPNFIGCLVAFGLALALANEFFFTALCFVPMLWLTGSRGAIIAGGLIAFAAFWRWSKRGALCALAIGLALAILNRGFGLSIFNRLGVWQDTLEHLTFLGSGWGSFADAYASWSPHRNMTLQLAPHAYNDLIEIIFELGLGAGFAWFWLAAVLAPAPRRFAFLTFAFFACGLTYWPLWLPLLPQTLAFMLGVASTNPKEHCYGR